MYNVSKKPSKNFPIPPIDVIQECRCWDVCLTFSARIEFDSQVCLGIVLELLFVDSLLHKFYCCRRVQTNFY